ncbi:MAG: 30S ribosomal protein S17 [Nanoarchaeota archaeon]|nr:30S ribosomal protein S17 [Nanoarchaeota archaeon]
MVKSKNIGINVKPPKVECTDKKCPFHGSLKVRGKIIKGIIVSKDVHTSATIESDRTIFIKKYERYLKKRSRIRVHNPPCINAQIGDEVKAMECHPLSKTKHFVIVEKLGHDIFVEQHIKEKAEAEDTGASKKAAKDEESVFEAKEEVVEDNVEDNETIVEDNVEEVKKE